MNFNFYISADTISLILENYVSSDIACVLKSYRLLSLIKHSYTPCLLRGKGWLFLILIYYKSWGRGAE